MSNKIKVYCSLKNIRLKRKVSTHPIEELSLYKYEWIIRQQERMTFEEPSPLEELFLEKIKGFTYTIFRQPFFQIGEHCYFLDFFVPRLKLAIEIDGPHHREKEQKEWDKERDSLFRKIGIKTVRFFPSELKKEDFRDSIFTPKVLKCLEKPVVKAQSNTQKKKSVERNKYTSYSFILSILKRIEPEGKKKKKVNQSKQQRKCGAKR